MLYADDVTYWHFFSECVFWFQFADWNLPFAGMGHFVSKKKNHKAIVVQRSARPKDSISKFIEDLVKRNCIVIFSKTSCPFCVKAKDVFEAMKVSYRVVEIDEREDGCFLQHTLGILTGSRTVPRVFVNGVCIGGAQQTIDLYKKGELLALIMKCATRCDEKTNKH
ncbi:glutaredoxin 2 [Callorhinchus milii]|uniref:glutaredoxin 2 n=1 Tax=Callorhinchus milii TaxID=7868 RepID=UPI001C3FC631|nr:glutaredoxin 2 [Callorhinchus milii]